jgi:hypothetical protein
MEEDSLQADVMRFMAIVAFCLIAILAMVRNSPGVEATVTTERVVQVAEIEPQEMARVETLADRAPLFESVIAAVVEPQKTPAIALPEPRPEPAPEPEPEPEPQPQPQTEPKPSSSPSESSEGLTLAFASEADFMRLISKGRITLYAYTGQSFLTTSDTYSFQTTNAPAQLYEIDRHTIPAHVIDAAERQEIEGLQWGVGLSPRIEKQISRYVEANVSGQLHIDRYEQVLHVEAG